MEKNKNLKHQKIWKGDSMFFLTLKEISIVDGVQRYVDLNWIVIQSSYVNFVLNHLNEFFYTNHKYLL